MGDNGLKITPSHFIFYDVGEFVAYSLADVVRYGNILMRDADSLTIDSFIGKGGLLSRESPALCISISVSTVLWNITVLTEIEWGRLTICPEGIRDCFIL